MVAGLQILSRRFLGSKKKVKKGTREKGFKKVSIVQALDDGDLEERDALVLEELFFVGEGLALNIPLFRVAVMHFDGFPGEIQAHILEVLVEIFVNLVQKALGVRFFRFFPGVFPDRHGGKNLFHMLVIADGAGDHADRLLRFKRIPVFEPAFKFVAVRADQVKSDHWGSILPSPSGKNYLEKTLPDNISYPNRFGKSGSFPKNDGQGG
jgi:hypothetical protein